MLAINEWLVGMVRRGFSFSHLFWCCWYLASPPHSNLANVASLLWHAYQSLPPPSNQVNWAGMAFPPYWWYSKAVVRYSWPELRTFAPALNQVFTLLTHETRLSLSWLHFTASRRARPSHLGGAYVVLRLQRGESSVWMMSGNLKGILRVMETVWARLLCQFGCMDGYVMLHRSTHELALRRKFGKMFGLTNLT